MSGNTDDVTQKIEHLADEFVGKLKQLLDTEGTAFSVFIYDNGWWYEKKMHKSEFVPTIVKIIYLTKIKDEQEAIYGIKYLLDYLMDHFEMKFDDILYELLDLRQYQMEW